MPRQTTPEHHFRSEEHPGSCEECCLQCYCMCCSVWLYMCCCKKMKRTLRVKLLWVYMIVVGLTAGIVLGVVFFQDVETDFTPSDMRIIDDKLSHVFCDSVDISTYSFDVEFNAYLIKDTPSIIPRKREYNETYTHFVQSENYVYKQYYLLENSRVTLTGTVDTYIDLNVIKGKENYDNFVNSNFMCFECVIDERSLFEGEENHIYWDITTTDLYFFVFVNREDGNWIDLHLSLKRAVYDVTTYIASCEKTTSCILDFDLAMSRTPSVLIHLIAEDKDHFDEGVVTIDTACVARSWVYVLIFLGIPTFLCVIFSILIFRYCSDPRNDTVHQLANERTPLLRNPDFSSVVVLPPKYEDVVRVTSDLPSYDEVMAVSRTDNENAGSSPELNNQSLQSGQNNLIQQV